MKDLIIIGAGTAGLTAAIYGVRAGLSVEVIENNIYGGQIINTASVDNYPGMPGVSGINLANTLYEQAQELGAQFAFTNIHSMNLTADPKEIITDGGALTAKAVVIAAGASPTRLGVAGEDRLTGAGVSYCAACDGAFHKGRDVVVVGGGNTAVEDALVLSGMCRRVYLVHRRKEFRAEKHMLEQLRKRDNIEWRLNAVISEIEGDRAVEGVRVTDLPSGTQSVLEVSGIFIAIGSAPNNGLLQEDLQMDSNGYIVAGEDCATNLPGVFVAGDIRTKKVRQLVTAASDGAVAALAAAEYILS